MLVPVIMREFYRVMPAICRVILVCRSKRIFFCQLPCAIRAAIVDLACPVIIGVPTEWRRSSDTIVHVSYFVTLSCHQHCLTCAVERAFSNKLPEWRKSGLDSEVPPRTNSGVLWPNVTVVFGPALTLRRLSKDQFPVQKWNLSMCLLTVWAWKVKLSRDVPSRHTGNVEYSTTHSRTWRWNAMGGQRRVRPLYPLER